MQTTKALIRLSGCAGWSAHLLFAYGIHSFSHDLAQFYFRRAYRIYKCNQKVVFLTCLYALYVYRIEIGVTETFFRKSWDFDNIILYMLWLKLELETYSVTKLLQLWFEMKILKAKTVTESCVDCINWAPPSEFVSSSIPSWQALTAHAQPFRGARDLAFCLKVPLDSLLVWRAAEVLARLRGCTGSPEPSLLA